MDLFAGPGGLGEGFSSFTAGGAHPFRIGFSVEMEESAHRTLTLRAFVRRHLAETGRLPREYSRHHRNFGHSAPPDWQSLHPALWKEATAEARQLELGKEAHRPELDRAIRRLRREYDDTILIGGPPCQAYSLVGRARSRGKKGYVPEQDARHFLFREYLRVLEALRPAAFVMENVKGMLSSRVESRLVFEMLMEDLSSLSARRGHAYEIRAISASNGRMSLIEPKHATDFIVRAEEYGIPQRRHRLFIVGIRSDVAAHGSACSVALPPRLRREARDVLETLPRLRSGITRTRDSDERWRSAVLDAAGSIPGLIEDREIRTAVRREMATVKALISGRKSLPPRSSLELPDQYGCSRDPLDRWLENRELSGLAQHSTRGHMEADLHRYLFVSAFARATGRSPKAPEFPAELAPRHRNWKTGKFADRFRVQLAGEPSTTVTSHIAKDGNYFVHFDPAQCRSLTVREAARLQTFPDDYLFLGCRTEQFGQIGNAVPPFLARQIAQLLHASLS